jgi:hypothetical protein
MLSFNAFLPRIFCFFLTASVPLLPDSEAKMPLTPHTIRIVAAFKGRKLNKLYLGGTFARLQGLSPSVVIEYIVAKVICQHKI